MKITIRHLIQIQAIYKHGTFANASKALNISQPALSRSISSLEGVLNVKLFNRSRIRNRPTAFGHHIIEKGESIIQRMYLLERDIKLITKGEIGKLAVGMGSFAAKIIFGAALETLCLKFPQISVTTFINAAPLVLEKLDNYKLDMAVVDIRIARKVAVNEINVHPLSMHPCNFFCRRDHPILKQKKITMKKILDYHLATVWLPDFAYVNIAKAAKIDKSNALEIRNQSIQCEDWEILFKIIASGNYIGFSALSVIMKSHHSSQFAILPPRFDGGYANLGIIVKKSLSYSPAMTKFQQYLVEEDQLLSKIENQC